VALSVLFGGNRFDSLSVADERIRQAGIVAVADASVPQCLISDIAKNVVGTIPHPKMDSLRPLEFEMLLAFDQWHRTGLSPIACGIPQTGKRASAPSKARCGTVVSALPAECGSLADRHVRRGAADILARLIDQ
jgi:hypothetical protein